MGSIRDGSDVAIAGQVAIVTGATGGIGADLALAFGRVGAKVGAGGRQMAATEAIALRIRESGGEATAIELHLTDLASIERGVTAVVDAIDRRDIPVNNAGVGTNHDRRDRGGVPVPRFADDRHGHGHGPHDRRRASPSAGARTIETMSASGPSDGGATADRGVPSGAWILLALPLAGLALLLTRPELDRHWEHHPSHFWLVLLTAAVSVVLAYLTNIAAGRYRDARLILVSLAFLASAGFLGLHALATPGVLVAGAERRVRHRDPDRAHRTRCLAAISRQRMGWAARRDALCAITARHAPAWPPRWSWRASCCWPVFRPLDGPLPGAEARGPPRFAGRSSWSWSNAFAAGRDVWLWCCWRGGIVPLDGRGRFAPAGRGDGRCVPQPELGG